MKVFPLYDLWKIIQFDTKHAHIILKLMLSDQLNILRNWEKSEFCLEILQNCTFFLP